MSIDTLLERWLRYARIALLVSTCALLYGCDIYESVLDGVYSPSERAQPKKLLQINGEVDPTLKIEIDILYTTAKKSCYKTVNWLEGAKSPRIHRVSIPIQQAGTRYSATVPLDKLESGFCEWAPFSVNYIISKDGKPQVTPVPPTPFFWITPSGATQLPSYEIECEEKIWFGKQGLGCQVPLGQYSVSMETASLQISFRERALTTPNKKLGQ
jgi:hypothetical protein